MRIGETGLLMTPGRSGAAPTCLCSECSRGPTKAHDYLELEAELLKLSSGRKDMCSNMSKTRVVLNYFVELNFIDYNMHIWLFELMELWSWV